MKVNTLLLKTMLGHVTKCKPNPLLEITNYYHLNAANGVLTLTATDSNNIIRTHMNIDKGAEIDVIIKADQFTKLINKTTVKNVELDIAENYLQVKANGAYKVEIVENEIYPSYNMQGDEYTINATDLNSAISSCRKAKSLTASEGVLFGYLLRNETMITADAIKVCQASVNTAIIEDILIPPTLADLLSALDKEECKAIIDGDKILFQGEDVEIYGALMEGADTYPDVTPLLEGQYPAQCEVDVKELLNSLDRLNLFVGLYDNNIINVAFMPKELDLVTNSKSCEAIPYVSSQDVENIGEAIYSINTKFLFDLVSAVSDPTVTICFGEEDTIKLHTPTTTMLLAMADDE